MISSIGKVLGLISPFGSKEKPDGKVTYYIRRSGGMRGPISMAIDLVKPMLGSTFDMGGKSMNMLGLGWALLFVPASLLATVFTTRCGLIGASIFLASVAFGIFIMPSVALVPFVGQKLALLNLLSLGGGFLVFAAGYQEYRTSDVLKPQVELEIAAKQEAVRTEIQKDPMTLAKKGFYFVKEKVSGAKTFFYGTQKKILKK